MAYILYTPPTHPGAASTPNAGAKLRAIGRIAGPLRVGYTQFRIDDQWHQKAVPTTDESLAADTDTDGQTLFFRGGHWHYIREELIAEMTADGIDVGEYRPDPDGFWPSDTTFPALTAYPGVA